MQPIERIVEWVKDKPVFWRHAVRLSLTKAELTESQHSLILAIAKMEYGVTPKSDDYPLYEAPITAAGLVTEASEIKLSSITEVVNVGSLAPNQDLTLNSNGLNIVYGDNGTGKSTYARILKHACLTRGDVAPILGNAFEKSSAESSAKLTVLSSGDSVAINWVKAAKDDENLKSIRVFDTDTASHYVNKKEGSLGYKPFALKVLDCLALALDYVKNQLRKELVAAQGVHKLPIFSDGTLSGQFVNGLNHLSNVADLDTHCLTDEESCLIEPLQQRIFELKSQSAASLKAVVNSKIARITPLSTKLRELGSSLTKKAYAELIALKLDADEKVDLAKELRTRLLSNLPFEGVGDTKWLTLWQAAESFIRSQPSETYFPPQVLDICPLCLQSVGSDSADKLASFKEFVAEQAIQDAETASQRLRESIDKIEGLKFDLRDHVAVIDELTTEDNDFNVEVGDFVQSLKLRRSEFLALDANKELSDIDKRAIDYCDKAVNALNEEAQVLGGQNDASHSALIEAKEQQLSELQSRQLVAEHKEIIIKCISQHALENKLKNIEEASNTRQVTLLSNDLSRDIVVEPLVKCFDEELKKFGFDRFSVEVKTRGSASQQLSKLEIVNGNKNFVAEIASEGEQRCIAIACFMAEIISDGRRSAVIFDDPVNSLDHRWREDIGKRLVEESLERQVVVFTHDIVFYKYLLECVEKVAGASVTQVRLDRNRKHTGIVDHTPPWDALPIKTRIGELKQLYSALDKVDQTGTELEYSHLCFKFYSMLRESWERLVEEKLFNGVVTRFGRSIQTQRIKKLIEDITQADYDVIDRGMTNCSAFFEGHDTATGLHQRPRKITEVKEDLDLIDNLLTALKKRR